jgi:hypothetical protein
MASPENESYWKESTRLKEKNARRSQRRKDNPGVHNPRSLSKKKENK